MLRKGEEIAAAVPDVPSDGTGLDSTRRTAAVSCSIVSALPNSLVDDWRQTDVVKTKRKKRKPRADSLYICSRKRKSFRRTLSEARSVTSVAVALMDVNHVYTGVLLGCRKLSREVLENVYKEERTRLSFDSAPLIWRQQRLLEGAPHRRNFRPTQFAAEQQLGHHRTQRGCSVEPPVQASCR
jgi:hypothetical protein